MYAEALRMLGVQAGAQGAGLRPGRVAMVGDTLATDILGGQAFNQSNKQQ